jgi:phospholipid/cholesterol/gamma-HCH transport system permease protein
VLAMTIALPLLTIAADFIGCFAGAVITMHEVDVTFRFVWEQMSVSIEIPDLMHGIMKSVFFGYFIGIIGCWNGLRTQGGTEGVGIATTRTVVYISVTILTSDLLLTRLFLAIYG